MRSHDTDESAHRAQLEVYRRMRGAERLGVGLELTAISRRLVAEGVRRRHPYYTDEQVRLATIRVWLGDELFRRAYPHAPVLPP